MKDIKYDSDLNTDIHFLNEDFPKLRRKSLMKFTGKYMNHRWKEERTVSKEKKPTKPSLNKNTLKTAIKRY